MISGWHDDYRNKDAGHDEMQAAIWRFYLEAIGKVTIRRYKDIYSLVDVSVEFPLIRRKSEYETGDIIGFADIAMMFDQKISDEEIQRKKERNHPDFKPERWHAFFEVKPKIYSVGGVIRQCKALANAAGKCGYRKCDIYPIVYEDDPSAALLRELWPGAWTWDRPQPGHPKPPGRQ